MRTNTRFRLRMPSTHTFKRMRLVLPALAMTSLLAVLFVAGSVTNRATAQTREPPSASPTGGEPLRLAGGVELTREHLAELTFRGPDPADFAYTGGEEHRDDEGTGRTLSGSATLSGATESGGSALLPQTPAAVTNWKAMDAMGGNAADAQIAVSTTHVVVTNRSVLAFFDKAGTSLQTLNAKDFYSPLGLNVDTFVPAPINQYFDLRAIFDPVRKRFWVVGLGVNEDWRTLAPASKRHIRAVAVSKTENPKDGWYMYWMDAVAHWQFNVADDVYQIGDCSDYPDLGIDSILFHEIHAVNHFDADGNRTFRYFLVTFHSADAMAAGLPGSQVPGWQFWDLENPDGTSPKVIQPVVHHSFAPRSFYVSRLGTDQLVVWSLTNALQPGQKMSAVAVTIPTPWNDPVDAPQKGFDAKLLKMTNSGSNALKAVYRDGFLYVVTNDRLPLTSFTVVRYIRVFVNTYPLISTNQNAKFVSSRFGFEGSEGAADAGWPAVEVNKDGNAAIVYVRSSATLYAEVRFSTYFANESDIRPNRLLKEGEATFDITNPATSSPLPWGEIAGASVDPKDDTGIWMAQQYAKLPVGNSNYAIWVGKVFGKQYFDLQFGGLTGDLTRSLVVAKGQVHNGGDASAPPSEVTFSLTTGSGRSVPLGKLKQDALQPGQSSDFDVTLQLPPRVRPGPGYRLRAKVTPMPAGDEYSHYNNVAEAPLSSG
jgi:hypothetical protein